MGYAHIVNLYRPEAQIILLFKEVFALEKIHGTSANIQFSVSPTPQIKLFSGGTNPVTYASMFDQDALLAKFIELGHEKITVYGESYGGKEQGMSYLYGKDHKFIVIDVKIGVDDEDDSGYFLGVPEAEQVAIKLGLEFVHYKKIPATLEFIDAERDADSVQAVRNGVDLANLPVLLSGKRRTALREGVVLRPLVEMKYRGHRICAKHKSDKFSGGGERKNTPAVDAPEKLKLYADAQEAAEEFCTEMRLTHVLDKLPAGIGMENVSVVIKAMIEDIEREAKGEILENKETRKAISQKTVAMFKKRFVSAIPKE
jgi:hypothetical protein